MEQDFFHDRERAEEAAYFRRRDADLIEKLREKARLSEIAHALAEKLHVDNPQLLRRIVDAGVTLNTGAAFLLAPLVQVAWADHHVSPEEHVTVLRLARERGIEPGSSDEAQLQEWLRERPADALFDAALEALATGLTVLPPDEREQRISQMIKACTSVAEVPEGVGKFLHQHSPITPEERRTLDAIWSGLMGEARGGATGQGDNT